MLKFFGLRRKSKLVVTVALTISLCILFLELFGNDSQTTWDHELRHELNSDSIGETLQHNEPNEPNGHKDALPSGQSVKYIGQHPVCSQSEQSTGQVLCSTLRLSLPAAAEDLKVNFDPISEEELEVIHGGDLEPGGLYRPKDCSPNQRVAIIVPYRDRDEHLRILLNHLHPFLKKQKMQYMIIVVEQAHGTKLNRAMLRNIGFVEGEKMCNFDCYFFHDVDMIPLREDNIYQCGDSPRHHAASLARWNFTIPYTLLIGGVASFKRDVFKKVNGYSNLYFGWGGEDDDLAFRVVKYHKMTIDRYPVNVSRYGDLSHKQSDVPESRLQLYYTWNTRVDIDGLNSLRYHIHMVQFRKLYTRIYVGINATEVLEKFQGVFNQTVETLRERYERLRNASIGQSNN